jgi:hypothetical protein
MKIKVITLLFLLAFSYSAHADFPTTQTVEISKLEVWPSNTGVSRYAGFLKSEVPLAGCTNNSIFFIEAGPGADAAYSTLLAALMAGKKVELYFTRCAYGPVADRIRIIFD